MRFTAHRTYLSAFEKYLKDHGFIHGKSAPHSPWQNGFIERSHRTDNAEFFNQYRFTSSEERKLQLRLWEMEYNYNRPHQGIGCLTPMQKFKQLSPFDIRTRDIT